MKSEKAIPLPHLQPPFVSLFWIILVDKITYYEAEEVEKMAAK